MAMTLMIKQDYVDNIGDQTDLCNDEDDNVDNKIQDYCENKGKEQL